MDRILQRRDTAANWSTTNPILAEGEIGIITDGAKGYKIGDGVTRWNALEYPANPTSVVGELGDSEVAVINQKAISNEIIPIKNDTRELNKTNVINTNYLFCENGSISASSGVNTNLDGWSRTDYVATTINSTCSVVISGNTIYGIARYYDINKNYLGYDFSQIQNVAYVRFVYNSNDIDYIRIIINGKSYITEKYKYTFDKTTASINENKDTISTTSSFNLFTHENEIWSSTGEIAYKYNWARTPLIKISEIYDVANTGIRISGRAYYNEADTIYSALFFDGNKNYIDGSGIARTITSGAGDYIEYDYITQYNAVYVAFNTYVEYYKYLAIKGLGVRGIQFYLDTYNSATANIDNIYQTLTNNFEYLFTDKNTDKSHVINDYISNKNSNDITKALFYNLFNAKINNISLWGKQDDFTLIVRNDGTLVENSTTNPLYAKKVNSSWIPKDINEIDLTSYCNTYDVCNKLPSFTGVDLNIYIYHYLRDEEELAEFGKSTLIGLIKKYYKETKGIITASAHIQGPYGGDYNYKDTTYPDAFAQILASNPADGGTAKQWLDKVITCISTLMNELTDDSGNKIPIIFRPFHETINLVNEPTTSSGFWWNWSTDEEYKEVYKLLVNRLRDTCDNLLFVYNPLLTSTTSTSEDLLLSRYPGDDYIDMIGVDLYEKHFKNFSNGIFGLCNLYSTIASITKKHNKIHYIPEIGNFKGEDPDFFNEVIKFFDKIGNVPIALTWNNQSSDYWYTPYDNSTPLYQSYYNFLNRNRLFTIKNMYSILDNI